MKVREVDDFLGHLDPEKRSSGRDGLKFGNPEAQVTGIGCTWTATLRVLREAVAKKLNLICVHESIFYWDDPDQPREPNLAEIYPTPTKGKEEFLAAHDIAVIRVHELWDTFPQHGIQDSWATAAGLGEVHKEEPHHKVYRCEKQTVGDLVSRIKKEMDLPMVRVIGDLHRRVERVSVGVGDWGMLHNVLAAQRLGAQVHIAGEAIEWQAVAYAEDHDFPIILATECQAQEYGMRNLAVYLGQRFKALRIEYLPTGDPFSYA
jgi:putative NIF3 family GTP cyclohydrolase 1 type 2